MWVCAFTVHINFPISWQLLNRLYEQVSYCFSCQEQLKLTNPRHVPVSSDLKPVLVLLLDVSTEKVNIPPNIPESTRILRTCSAFMMTPTGPAGYVLNKTEYYDWRCIAKTGHFCLCKQFCNKNKSNLQTKLSKAILPKQVILLSYI